MRPLIEAMLKQACIAAIIPMSALTPTAPPQQDGHVLASTSGLSLEDTATNLDGDNGLAKETGMLQSYAAQLLLTAIHGASADPCSHSNRSSTVVERHRTIAGRASCAYSRLSASRG